MPTIPVYSSSPIAASKATGVTPQTQVPEGSRGKQEPFEALPGAAAAATTSIPGGQHFPGPVARPGAGLPLPAQTMVAQPNPYAPVHSTPMADKVPSRVEHGSPPAPQPGAVPMPAGRQIPPPPKAGESAAAERQAQAAMTAPPRLPPPMAYQAPQATQPIQGRSSTTTTTPPSHIGGPYPTPLQGPSPSAGNVNPPGYQQDADASGFSRYQGQGHGFGGSQNSSNWSSAGGEDQGGVWDTARKWATAAGESLAAAESEVWKKINKG